MENPFKKQVILSILDVIYPQRCLFCQNILNPEQGEAPPLCPACRDRFPRTGPHGLQEGQNFHWCQSALFYTDLFKDSFHRYKFYRRWHYSEVYGQWMWEHLQQQEVELSFFDCICWAPLSLPRWLKRGYDQSQRLAKEISHYSGLPLMPFLQKWKHIAPQSGTENAEERRRNIKGVYRLRRGADVVGKRILLVDDIITTGSTLEEASRVLLEGGAAEVCCLTLARGL